ncbi:hypothetical protein [Sulfurovum sp.]|uniref:hypothetical protein n=1 Tax=Sulfurovum sp. TaxID=1969726 RepID=UPI00356AC9E0
MKEGISIREGDVYRWYYKNDTEYRASCGGGTAYWCMDNQCYATERSGEIYLLDTYWIDYGQEYIGNEVTYVNPEKVDLEFVCNLHDVEFIKYGMEDYDKVYNISRQKGCYKAFAVDKGATVSNKALRAKYQRELEKAESDKRCAEWDIERYTKLLSEP